MEAITPELVSQLRASEEWAEQSDPMVVEALDQLQADLKDEKVGQDIAAHTLTELGYTQFNGARRSPLSPTKAEFPSLVFPEWLRRYASEVAASCEIPTGVVGFGVMGMLSACYGMHVLVAVKNRYVTYCHDWFFLVAKVSLGKSPVFSHLQAPLRQIQDVLRNLTGDEDSEEPRVQCIVSDASPEALIKVQAENSGAVALVSPETTLLSQMSSTTRPIPLQGYLSSHTGEAYEVLRITRGPNDIECARLAIFAATQEVGLKEILNRPEIITKGVVPRCTFYVAPAITEQDLRDDDPAVSEELALKYEETLRELGLKYRGNPAVPFQFSPEAKRLRDAWRNNFKRKHRLEGGKLYHLTEHCSKLEDKVVRWAGLLHVLWCEEEGRQAGVIGVDDWTRALELVPFDLRHFQAALDVIEEGPAEVLAAKLRAWFRSRRGQTLRLRDIGRHFRPFRRAEDRVKEEALGQLEDEGIVRQVNTSKGTKPSPGVVVL